LVDNSVRGRNRCPPWRAQAAFPELNQLRVRQAREGGVVAYGWEIRTLGGFLHVLFLIDRVLCDSDIVVVLQRQVNRFMQCDVARRRGTTCFVSQDEVDTESRRRQ
jgi:hypothetical protein